MSVEMGEYVVGAYLKIINGCDFIDYNVRRPGGGLAGLDELDVIGLDFKNKVAYLCEVTTHIRGLLYKDNRTTVERIKKKHEKQQKYAKDYLPDFPSPRFMFWSPVVPEGYITQNLQKNTELELIINEEYTSRINELRRKAKKLKNDTGNPFFRALQILEHLRQ
jgi:hypothetical protein